MATWSGALVAAVAWLPPAGETGFSLAPRTRGPIAWGQRVDSAALALQPNESPHPFLESTGFTIFWRGVVRLAVAGDYTFAIEYEGGDASLNVQDAAGTPVAGQAGGVAAVGAPATLEATVRVERPGSVSLWIRFKRDGDAPARMQTRWSLAGAGRSNFGPELLPTRVVSVPEDMIAECAEEAQAASGRAQLGARGCIACHEPGAASVALPAWSRLDLTKVAIRADGDWITRFIADPAALRPGVAMPALADAAQARDLAAWLVSMAGASAAGGGEIIDPALARRGEALYHEVGCVACHGPLLASVAAGAPPSRPFDDLRGKWRLAPLAEWLRDPAQARPGSTMPSLALDVAESEALAHFLVSRWGGAPARTLPVPDAAAVERGREHFAALGCVRCHDAAGAAIAVGGGPPLLSLDDGRGCLADADAARGRAPRHDLSPDRLAELRAGVATLRRRSSSSFAAAPGERLAAAFDRHDCGRCHERAGRGGAGDRAEFFRSRVEADLGDEGRLPPKLDDVGAKLQSPWLAHVVADGARARPYLATRMPRYGAAQGALFAAGFASQAGEWRSDDPLAAAGRVVAESDDSSEPRALLGRQLAGSGGMNCVTCHSFGERPSAGTPGLDFLAFATRLRRDWFSTYVLAPARSKPGTRMPSYFEDGKSVVGAVLDGDPARQTEALWAWFERAATMPAPEGVPSGARLVLPVADRPRVFRCFLPRAGNRGVAIGTPDGLHFSFDADQVRLVEAWQGEFLDVAPVWEGRGGGVANLLGPVVWSARPGPLLQLGEAASWPDANGRATGAKFLGHRLEPDGTPVLEWQLREQSVGVDVPADPTGIRVEERFLPDPRRDVLFVRRVALQPVPPDAPITLLPQGERVRLRLQLSEVDLLATDSSSEIASPADLPTCDRPLRIRPRAGRDAIVLHLEVLP